MFRRYLGYMLFNRIARGTVHKPTKTQALLRLPTLLRLCYVLLRDPRVPRWQRSAVVAALVLVFSPIDFVGDLPVIGQLWDFTLAVVIIEQFIQFAPAEVVNEHITRMGLQGKVPLRTV